MKVSYRWVRDVAPGIGLTPAQAMERLALRGAPVEEVVDLAEGLRDVVIGRVLETRPHPNADRLTLCRVAGPEGEVPVVCGAPVVVEGAYYPFAPVGAVLPGGLRIGKRKIRGEVSQGMLCSERELELGEDHAGIMLLDGEYETGVPFAHAAGLDDVRFDVEVTPNRGDLLSHVGIARELHPEGQAGIALPGFPGGTPAVAASFARGGAEAGSAGVRIRIEDADLCSRYLGAVIRGLRVGPSPKWLADRLRAAGARSINNVVDATNYVMLELGQPLHAFDLARLAGATIVVGRAREGESLVTLDGEERAGHARHADDPRRGGAGGGGGGDGGKGLRGFGRDRGYPAGVRAVRTAPGTRRPPRPRHVNRRELPLRAGRRSGHNGDGAEAGRIADRGGCGRGGGGRVHRCPSRVLEGAGGVAAAFTRAASARCGIHGGRDHRAVGAVGVRGDGPRRGRARGGRARPPELRHAARGRSH